MYVGLLPVKAAATVGPGTREDRIAYFFVLLTQADILPTVAAQTPM